MKQVMISLAAVVVAALILAAMVFYTLSVIRATQIRILTGELASKEVICTFV